MPRCVCVHRYLELYGLFYASVSICIGVWTFVCIGIWVSVHRYLYASVSKMTKNQKVSQCQDVFLCMGVSMHRYLYSSSCISVHRRLAFCYALLFDCSGLISRLIVQMGYWVG